MSIAIAAIIGSLLLLWVLQIILFLRLKRKFERREKAIADLERIYRKSRGG